MARRAVERYPLCTHEQPWRCMAKGTVTRNGELYAEVAYPLSQFAVVMLSSPLRNDLTSVGVVRNARAGARARSPPCSRSCSAAASRRCSRGASGGSTPRRRGSPTGSSSVPIVDTDPDELGQLARTFDRMRVRLASLDRARAEFIANASHELRTPLFSLAGFLELLASEELDAETRSDFMVAIRSQVTRLTKLATDLLDLSKLDAGRLTVVTESVDLATARRADRHRVRAARRGERAHARRRRRGQRAGARRRGARAADRSDPRRERDRAHAGRHEHPRLARRRTSASRG